MGMDVVGKNEEHPVGGYFRNNVWWWRPLWDYCAAVAPSVIDKKLHESGHYNDGAGLNDLDSVQLADLLQQEVEQGNTKQLEMAHAQQLDALDDETCFICEGTGKRQEPPATGAGDIPCNGCQGTGAVRPSATHYPFSEENVVNFIQFLRNCGGFEIC
jgi:hypothetical protein